MDYGNIENLLNGLEDTTNRILRGVFKIVTRDVRFGRATGLTAVVPSKNFGGGFVSFTTPGTANKEFAVAHSFGRPPYLLVPAAPLNQANAAIVRLTVSRAADATYVYLKSPDTNAVAFVYLEG